MTKISIHPLLVWGIPVLLMIAQFLSEALLPDEIKPAFFSEEGPHEKVQAFIMWVAVYFAVRLFIRLLGLTVVMVTHDLDSLWGIATRVAILGRGTVLGIGTMQELSRSDDPILRDYFHGPRGRSAREQVARNGQRRDA